MKKISTLLAISVLTMFAFPAFAGQPAEVWHCEMADDASEDDVLNGVGDWLDAAKKVPGGESFEIHVMFPAVVNFEGDTDVWILLLADSFEAWGKFWDHYPDSDVGDIEDANATAFVCPDNLLFEAMEPDD